MIKTNWVDTLKKEGAVKPRRALSEEAAETLREFILLEKLAPGTPIPERELSEALGVSRTPMREALRMLETEGLVVYSVTRRPRVADPSFEELSQCITVLGALEALAGEIACAEASDEEIDDIVDLGVLMKESSENMTPLDFFQLDMKFHCKIIEASRNEPLIETHRQYNARLWRARFISSARSTRREGTLHQHMDISGAIKRRDPIATGDALRGHLETTITNIESRLAKETAKIQAKDEHHEA
jgi:DNA-binding GntR family transcriptional regulator